MKKEIIVPIIATLVVGVLAFWGGTVYTKKTIAKNMTNQGQRQGTVQGRFGNGQMGMMGGRMGGGANLANGEIIAKDEKSITIKLRDGGSKIIFLSGTTTINKSAAGTIDDLKVGTQITATGTTNTDGSVSAQMVQIRPEIMAAATAK